MKHLKKFENFDLGRFNEDEEDEKQDFIEDVEDVDDNYEEVEDEEEFEDEEDEEENQRRRVWGDEVVEKKKINAGFQAYLDKQKGKKVDKKDEKDDKVGLAGDITITQKIIDMPIVLMGEFINYSLGESDMAKGNIVMAQADITPIQKLGMLDKATLSLHVGMEMPKEGKARTNLIGQLLLQLDKQFLIFAQVFGDKYEDADEMTGQGLRVWFMYLF